MILSPTSRAARTTLLALSIASVTFLGLVASTAAATPARGRITRGDVTAAFQARTTGGYLNQLRGRTVAAPLRGFKR